MIKSRFHLTGFLSLLKFTSFSQAPESYLVKAGEQPGKVIVSKDQYMYPEFLKELLYFPQGEKSRIPAAKF